MSADISLSLVYYVGDTTGIAVTVTDPDASDAAYNLTGCSLAFTVTDPTAGVIWSSTIGSGISIISLVGGTALIQPTLLQSQSLKAGRNYPARVVLTDATGAIITVSTGFLTAL